MSHYNNPLHPSIPVNLHSPFSALSGGNPAPHYFTPTQRRVPQPQYVPSSKWKATICRAPDPRPITFDLKGRRGIGVPMRELCSRGGSALMAMMEGAGDQVLAHYGLTRIRLRILWPGYPHVDWERVLELNLPSGPITRSQIAAQIAVNYARYIDKTQYEPVSSQGGEWRVGQAGIPFDKLVLVSLWNVFDDVWQAEVAFELR